MSRMDRMASDLNRNGPVERDIEQVLSSTFFCTLSAIFVLYPRTTHTYVVLICAFIATFFSNQCNKRINVVEFLSVLFCTAV